MALIDRIEKSAQITERFNEGVLYSLEDTAKRIENYNERIADFFIDASRDPVKTFKQLYNDVLTYLKH